MSISLALLLIRANRVAIFAFLFRIKKDTAIALYFSSNFYYDKVGTNIQ